MEVEVEREQYGCGIDDYYRSHHENMINCPIANAGGSHFHPNPSPLATSRSLSFLPFDLFVTTIPKCSMLFRG